MMEGVEFQYRPSSHTSESPRYPLTLDQRLTQGDRYREATEALDGTLRKIEHIFSSAHIGAHTGGPNCERCSNKKRQIRNAYREYYLSTTPGRWDEHLTEYRQDMGRFFNEGMDLRTIQDRCQQELMDHFKADLCTPRFGEPMESVEYKNRVEGLLLQNSVEDALRAAQRMKMDRMAMAPGLSGQGGVDGTNEITHPAGFEIRLQGTQTAEERATLYAAYYCTTAWNDTSQARNMKTKYAKMFGEKVPHDEVLARWKQEATEMKEKELDELKQKLGELKMAQSAQLKSKKRKMERDARMKDKEYIVVPHLVNCTLPGCEIQMDVGQEGPLECAVCDWLSRKGDERKRFFYCSEDHNELDFDEHDKYEHACIMGHDCFFAPLVGPPGDTGVCGVCPDCEEHQIVSLFCSQDCYHHNLEVHRDDVHYDAHIENRAEQLHMFSPEPDLILTAA